MLETTLRQYNGVNLVTRAKALGFATLGTIVMPLEIIGSTIDLDSGPIVRTHLRNIGNYYKMAFTGSGSIEETIESYS